MGKQIKKETDLIIIGGGIFGSAIAYYYKRDNPGKNVAVYEKNEICSGNTSLAAALMSRARADKHMIPLSIETYRVIPELETLTGEPVPVKYNGAIHIASDPESEIKLNNLLSASSENGIEWEYLTEMKTRAMVRWLDSSKAAKIAFIHGEAITDPYILCMSFANAAKKLGVNFYRHKTVKKLIKSGRQITGIITIDGSHEAECTVMAAGAWSVTLAYDAGIKLPMAPVRSQYWISEQLESIFEPNSPAVIIPKAGFYARPMGNSLLFGIRESKSVYTDPRQLPDNINEYLFSKDHGISDLILSYDQVVKFFPGFGDTGIKNYIAGFSCYTPDNNFITGHIPGLSGLLLATGCCGAGISAAGGIGLGISSLASGRKNPFDFSNFRVDRFGQIDPFSESHMISCGLARSGKTSG
jgi:4-methylaminobutanoate oxidase (formaldehyde-forming)